MTLLQIAGKAAALVVGSGPSLKCGNLAFALKLTERTRFAGSDLWEKNVNSLDRF